MVAICHMDTRIRCGDLRARMPKYLEIKGTNGGPNLLVPIASPNALSMRATRFRMRAGLLPRGQRGGSIKIEEYLRNFYPKCFLDANCSKGYRDLTEEEVADMKAPNVGKFKYRARVENRLVMHQPGNETVAAQAPTKPAEAASTRSETTPRRSTRLQSTRGRSVRVPTTRVQYARTHSARAQSTVPTRIQPARGVKNTINHESSQTDAGPTPIKETDEAAVQDDNMAGQDSRPLNDTEAAIRAIQPRPLTPEPSQSDTNQEAVNVNHMARANTPRNNFLPAVSAYNPAWPPRYPTFDRYPGYHTQAYQLNDDVARYSNHDFLPRNGPAITIRAQENPTFHDESASFAVTYPMETNRSSNAVRRMGNLRTDAHRYPMNVAGSNNTGSNLESMVAAQSSSYSFRQPVENFSDHNLMNPNSTLLQSWAPARRSALKNPWEHNPMGEGIVGVGQRSDRQPFENELGSRGMRTHGYQAFQTDHFESFDENMLENVELSNGIMFTDHAEDEAALPKYKSANGYQHIQANQYDGRENNLLQNYYSSDWIMVTDPAEDTVALPRNTSASTNQPIQNDQYDDSEDNVLESIESPDCTSVTIKAEDGAVSPKYTSPYADGGRPGALSPDYASRVNNVNHSGVEQYGGEHDGEHGGEQQRGDLQSGHPSLFNDNFTGGLSNLDNFEEPSEAIDVEEFLKWVSGQTFE